MENYKQLCVWPGTTLGDSLFADVEQWFKDEMGVRIKMKEVVLTLPDLDNDGEPVPGTGERSDVFFYVHDEDVIMFAIPRMKLGIRWWEDVISYNENSRHLYTEEFIEANPVNW